LFQTLKGLFIHYNTQRGDDGLQSFVASYKGYSIEALPREWWPIFVQTVMHNLALLILTFYFDSGHACWLVEYPPRSGNKTLYVAGGLRKFSPPLGPMPGTF
jgi:hypothetical protein